MKTLPLKSFYCKCSDSQLDKRLDGLRKSGVKYHKFMTKSIKKTELVSKKTKGERKKRLANEQKIAELKVHVQRVLKESDKYKEKIDKNEVRLLMKKGKKKYF